MDNLRPQIPDSQIRWYAVQTKPRQEDLAERFLQHAGIETFHPRVSPNKTLFTSYIFARFPVPTHLRRIKYAQGVRNVVAFGGIPAPVESSFLDAIRFRTKNGFVVLDSPPFSRGERVSVKEGPLEGLEGIFDSQLKGSDRAVILMNILAGQGRIILPARLLRKTS